MHTKKLLLLLFKGHTFISIYASFDKLQSQIIAMNIWIKLSYGQMIKMRYF